MFKELIICIIIIVLIFSLDLFTQNYTKQSVIKIVEELSSIKEYILKTDEEEIENNVETLDEDWKKIHDRLAYYIEHDELEKVDTSIVAMKSYIETQDFPSAINELEVSKFVLEHIQEKYAFNIQNIF